MVTPLSLTQILDASDESARYSEEYADRLISAGIAFRIAGHSDGPIGKGTRLNYDDPVAMAAKVKDLMADNIDVRVTPTAGRVEFNV